MAGEPPPDDVGTTPGNGAPQSTRETKADPFSKGYGTGIAKGRREGERAVLEALGYSSVEEIRAEIEARQSAEEGKATAAEAALRKLQRDYEQRSREVETLARLADEARLDRLRAAALERGVGRGRQLDAFVAMYGERVRWGSDRALEVVRREGGETVPTGEALDQWIDAAIAESPFLAPPRGTTGGGSRIEPASGPPPASGSTSLASILGLPKK
jgi:hypothetical protein